MRASRRVRAIIVITVVVIAGCQKKALPAADAQQLEVFHVRARLPLTFAQSVLAVQVGSKTEAVELSATGSSELESLASKLMTETGRVRGLPVGDPDLAQEARCVIEQLVMSKLGTEPTVTNPLEQAAHELFGAAGTPLLRRLTDEDLGRFTTALPVPRAPSDEVAKAFLNEADKFLQVRLANTGTFDDLDTQTRVQLVADLQARVEQIIEAGGQDALRLVSAKAGAVKEAVRAVDEVAAASSAIVISQVRESRRLITDYQRDLDARSEGLLTSFGDAEKKLRDRIQQAATEPGRAEALQALERNYETVTSVRSRVVGILNGDTQPTSEDLRSLSAILPPDLASIGTQAASVLKLKETLGDDLGKALMTSKGRLDVASKFVSQLNLPVVGDALPALSAAIPGIQSLASLAAAGSPLGAASAVAAVLGGGSLLGGGSQEETKKQFAEIQRSLARIEQRLESIDRKLDALGERMDRNHKEVLDKLAAIQNTANVIRVIESDQQQRGPNRCNNLRLDLERLKSPEDVSVHLYRSADLLRGCLAELNGLPLDGVDAVFLLAASPEAARKAGVNDYLSDYVQTHLNVMGLLSKPLLARTLWALRLPSADAPSLAAKLAQLRDAPAETDMPITSSDMTQNAWVSLQAAENLRSIVDTWVRYRPLLHAGFWDERLKVKDKGLMVADDLTPDMWSKEIASMKVEGERHLRQALLVNTAALAQQTLLSGDVLLPTILAELDKPDVTAALEKNEVLRRNALMLCLWDRVVRRRNGLTRYTLAYKTGDVPGMLALLDVVPGDGEPPVFALKTPLAVVAEPHGGNSPNSWVWSTQTLGKTKITLPTPEGVAAARLDLPPELRRLVRANAGLVEQLALLRLRSRLSRAEETAAVRLIIQEAAVSSTRLPK